MPKDPASQAIVDAVLSGGPATRQFNEKAALFGAAATTRAEQPERRTFVAFDNDDLQRATDLMQRLIAIADQDGVPAALAEVQRLLPGEELSGLTQYALKLFMTHYPPARAQLRFQPLELRQPNLVSNTAAAAPRLTAGAEPGAAFTTGAAGTAEAAAKAYPSGATPPENRVSSWREDPLLNEHHEHWHLVYPTTKPLGDRHGELFAYMHEQMLARYDAERLGLGLGRVEAFLDYKDAIPQGYDPGKLQLWTGDGWTPFGPRPAGAHLSDLEKPFDTRPGAKLEAQTNFRDALTKAAKSGAYELISPPVEVTIDNLGDTEEGNAGTIEPDPARTSYGNFHNDGHIHFMYFDNNMPFGVMADPATAVRDPIFFRWHKQVDDIFHTYQDTLPPYDFDRAPKARIRAQDIFFLPESITAGAAADAFGGAHWDDPFTSGHAGAVKLVDELTTEMLTRDIEAVDENGKPVKVPIDYLSHDDFWYVLRVENLEERAQPVALRLFIAPEEHAKERSMWIEMDKFVYNLKPRERAVIVRAAEHSSVIRKPALKPANLASQHELAGASEQSTWCDCGWPYTLLLPRGDKQGAAYRIVVMLSFGDEITQPPANGCSSISYCGLEDKEYPDKMDMGYPFNRHFPKGIEETLRGRHNIASRKFAIRLKS